jgi:Zn-dependent peptidase ImmA (M78 family)/transcriptional regulator with XRE-family HTH domain
VTNAFNPEMLILARESRSYNQTELARLLDVQQGTVSKLESGFLRPTSEIIDKLVEHLKYPAELFSQTDRIYGFNSTVFFHRKRQSLPDRVLRRLHAQMNLTRMRIARLVRSLGGELPRRFQPMNPNDYQGGVVTVAKVVRSMWMLPPGPVKNVTESIEEAGGIVVKFDFGTRQADAISEWIDPYPPIFLVNSNSDISGDRYRLTLAHEAAHIVLHHGQLPTPEMEEEANTFAAEFMMPRREIKASLYGMNMAKLAMLKRHWRVSMQALIQRAYELKIITDSQRKYLFINVSRKTGSRIHEPLESEIPVEQPKLFRSLIDRHTGLGYSVPELARLMLYKDVDEFRVQCLDERRLQLIAE